MSRAVFLDTSAIFAITDRGDHSHQRTLDTYKRAQRFVTHFGIFLEAFSLISKRISKPVALDVIQRFRASPRIESVLIDGDLLEAGWRRAAKFRDKEWDWIDCVSFELMERRGIQEALTHDHHFRQAGFTILPET
ncbi:MAG TPA: PIN domain-containing protein [Chthoniobacterales bacterium]